MIVIYKDGQILKANSDIIQLDSLLKELDW